MAFEVVAVNKALLSVRVAAQQGHAVLFEDDGSAILVRKDPNRHVSSEKWVEHTSWMRG